MRSTARPSRDSDSSSRASAGRDGDEARGFWGFWKTTTGLITALASLIGAVGAVLALVLPGHHGTTTSSSAPATPTGVTRASWIAAADEVCHTLQQGLAVLGQPLSTVDLSAYESGLRADAALINTAAQNLDAISKPSQDVVTIDSLVTNLSKTSLALSGVATDVSEGDGSAAEQDLASAQQASDTATTLMKSLGACQ